MILFHIASYCCRSSTDSFHLFVRSVTLFALRTITPPFFLPFVLCQPFRFSMAKHGHISAVFVFNPTMFVHPFSFFIAVAIAYELRLTGANVTNLCNCLKCSQPKGWIHKRFSRIHWVNANKNISQTNFLSNQTGKSVRKHVKW